jgi:alpha-glucosidase
MMIAYLFTFSTGSAVLKYHSIPSTMNTNTHYLWWQKGVIYEIYPRSFKDSSNDGVGDLKGIIEKLDYLKWLGIDAIWIGPFYPSPMADFGYDITDYKGVHPMFGTLADFDNLLVEAHRRHIKVIIDFVPNHTSDQHPWFKESSSSKVNAKHDWYLWKDPDDHGNVPNNWLSVFGGPAWKWSEERQQYYYHAFLSEQPDLNLRHPEVQEAVFDIMRFWLQRGVDGLRVDVMWHLYKDKWFRDNPVNPDYKEGQPAYDKLLPLYSTDHPDVMEIVSKMRSVMDEYQEKVMIGEMYLSIYQTVAYYGPNNRGAHLPGNFTLLLLPWNARKIAVAIDDCESSLPEGAWPNWVLGNHDRPRLADRIGKDQLRNAAILLLTLRGTPTMYYGEEIGMHNVDIPDDEMQDPQGKKMKVNRDAYRTPMQWNKSNYAGFTIAKPWLRISDDYTKVNVEDQQKDEHSLIWLYKKLLELRKAEPALIMGRYIPVPAEDNLLVYIREYEDVRILVILNFEDKPVSFKNEKFFDEGKILLDSDLSRMNDSIKNTIQLKGNEGLVIKLGA